MRLKMMLLSPISWRGHHRRAPFSRIGYVTAGPPAAGRSLQRPLPQGPPQPPTASTAESTEAEMIQPLGSTTSTHCDKN